MRRIVGLGVALAALVAVGCSSKPSKFDQSATGGNAAGNGAGTGTTSAGGSSGSSGSSGTTGAVDAGPCADPNATLSVIAAPTTLANPGGSLPSSGNFSVIAKDGAGNPLSDCSVAFRESPADTSTLIVAATPDVATDGAGTATTVLNSTQNVGTAHVTATMGTATTSITIQVGPQGDGGNQSGCSGDLSTATLAVFSMNPNSLGVQGGTLPTSANLQMIAKYANGAAATGCTVTFAEQSGESLVAINPGSAAVDGSGLAATAITSGQSAGTAHIVATLGGTITTVVPITIGTGSGVDAGPPTPNAIQFVAETPNSPPILGIAGSGINEQGSMTFKVTDQTGLAIQGVTVAFGQLTSTQFVTITTPTGATDNSGQVTVSFHSGSTVGIADISATVLDVNGNPTTVVASQQIPVRGARPSASGFSFQCSKDNLPVYTTTAKLETVICHIRLSDRFGNRVGIPTPVTFHTEAGAISASVLTAQFDSTNPSTEGTADVTFTSDVVNGFSPADVAPVPGEPSYTKNGAVLNPRDQLVTIIAITQGEEAFNDSNGNNIFEPQLGETFVDMGDPFIDANDDNLYDAVSTGGAPEQRFCGSQNVPGGLDGGACPGASYSYGNGVWDQNGTIWTSTHLVFTGLATASNTDPFGVTDLANCIPYGGGSETIGIYAYDQWLNLPASGTTYIAGLLGSPSNVAIQPALISNQDSLGTIGLGYKQVAASDGGSCNTSNGSACVVNTYFTGFSRDSVGTLTFTNSNSAPDGGGTCAQNAQALNAQVTATTPNSGTGAALTTNFQAGSFLH
ncbi:MAG: Ig-like domain-containing protein [Deltaproteobacteria bacterium]|nr:Ig-like domain-containing protein [Deltaproteobacteria bacterium]